MDNHIHLNFDQHPHPPLVVFLLALSLVVPAQLRKTNHALPTSKFPPTRFSLHHLLFQKTHRTYTTLPNSIIILIYSNIYEDFKNSRMQPNTPT